MTKTAVIKRRLGAITNINQITKAMQIITVARTKGVQNQLKQAKKYHQEIKAFLEMVGTPPLPKNEAANLTQVIIVGSNQGFCGSFNGNLFTPLEFSLHKEEKLGHKIEIFAIGKKICEYLKTTKRDFHSGYNELLEKPFFEEVCSFIAPHYQDYSEGKISRIILIYNSYQSMLNQQSTALSLAPVQIVQKNLNKKVLFEPSLKSLQNRIFKLYICSHFYLCLLESISGELGCRLVTMKNAADNSKSLIKSLTLSAHKIRQAGITQELSEIMTTFEALKEEE